MALRRRQVDQPALAQHVQPAPVLHAVLLHHGPHLPHLAGQLVQRLQVDLRVEVARVGEDGAVLHPLEVPAVQHVHVAGHGHEHVALFRGPLHRQHTESVHGRLQRLHRVDLGHHHIGSMALGAAGQAAAAPAIPGHDEGLARQQHVGGPDDAVDRRLAGPVAIVEQVLGVRLVDRDDRVAQHTLRGHRLQPDDTGGGLLGAAEHGVEAFASPSVEHRDQVGAVVHGEVRAMVERRADVGVVGVVVLALDGVGPDPVDVDQGRRDGVVGGQRVGGAERGVGAPRLQRDHQVRRLRRDVQAGRNPQALEGSLTLEPLPDQQQHGHLPRGPFDQVIAGLRQAGVLDVPFPGSDAHNAELLDHPACGVLRQSQGEASLAPTMSTSAISRGRGTPRLDTFNR